MYPLEIIQGDSVEASIELEGVEAEYVTALKFQCDALGKTYDLVSTLEPTVWIIRFPSEDTGQFRIGRFLYNLVATFNSGKVLTILYNAQLEVLQKTNLWTEAN